ncbi:MAG: FliG C-terminal domain-containing protein [Pseudomonadota bacterium]
MTAALPAKTTEGSTALELQELTKPQKAAVIIAALGSDAAQPVIERIGDNNLRAFSGVLLKLKKIPRPALEQAIADFLAEVDHGSEEFHGGLEEVRNFLSLVLKPDAVDRMIEDVEGPSGRNIWEKLGNVGEEDLSAFLAKEHPQTVAFILTKLTPEKAAAILDQFDQELVRKIVSRLSQLPSIDNNVLRTVSESLMRDFLTTVRRNRVMRRPSQTIGSIMNFVSASHREMALEFLEENRPELAHEVRRTMFTFNDIADRVPPMAVAAIMRSVESATFLRAIKYAMQSMSHVSDFFFANMSTRLADQMREDIDKLPPLKMSEAEAASATVLKAINDLVDSGDFKLKEMDEGEDTENYL